MNKFRILIIAGYNIFIEQAQAIECCLKKRGINVIIDNPNEVLPGDFDVNIIFQAGKSWAPTRKQVGTSYKVMFQTEQLWKHRLKNGYHMGNAYERILEMFPENVQVAKADKVKYCPVGYSPVWENNLPEVEEDIDVLFYGSLTPYRKKQLSKLRKFNIRASEKLFGLKRNELIMRSKIILNMKAQDKWFYAPMHNLPAQANKKFVLNEKNNGGYGLFKPDIHFKEYSDMNECIDLISYWLEHEKERKEFSINAYEDIIKNCRFETNFYKSMKGLI